MICISIVGRYNVTSAYQLNPDCIVSIKDPMKQWHPDAVNFSGPKLLLDFEDWEHDLDGGPEESHIKQIITLGQENKGKTFVANCEAGVSRSSATAIILQHIGGKPIKANCEDLTVRFPLIFPNFRMLKFASKLLDDREIFDEACTWEPLWRKRWDRRMGRDTGYY